MSYELVAHHSPDDLSLQQSGPFWPASAGASAARTLGFPGRFASGYLECSASEIGRAKKLVLDFDCTDDRVHGLQEGCHFHGFYYDFCFLPLNVFCGERLLVFDIL
jgi:hypothetical protein